MKIVIREIEKYTWNRPRKASKCLQKAIPDQSGTNRNHQKSYIFHNLLTAFKDYCTETPPERPKIMPKSLQSLVQGANLLNLRF